MIEAVSNSMPWIGLILGYGFLTHGIILFNDGLYWDGWMLDVWQQHKDENSMRRFFSEVGMPILSSSTGYWVAFQGVKLPIG